MFIRLTSSQIPAFWDLYKQSLIVSNNIPREHQQDFAIRELEKMLSGLSQAWMGYVLDENGDKRIQYTLTSRIVYENYKGIRALYLSSLYRYGGLDSDMLVEADAHVTEFGRSVGCKVIIVEYSLDIMAEHLNYCGYETFLKMSRKFI